MIQDALPEFLGGVFVFAFIALVGALWRSRTRLREILYGPRLTVHMWSEVVVDGRLRRTFPWPSVVVGLGRDPIRRGNLEPRLKAQQGEVQFGPLRDFLVPPLYPLGEKVTAGADSLVAVHVAIFNTGRDVIDVAEAGAITLSVDAPSLHILDWARGTFDEPGWARSVDEGLMVDDWSKTQETWTEYSWQGREIEDDSPTLLDVRLRSASKPGERNAKRDALGVLASSRRTYPIRLNVSVVARANRVPMLVKPWRPATSGERLRHPMRTVWRRVVTAGRYGPAKE